MMASMEGMESKSAGETRMGVGRVLDMIATSPAHPGWPMRNKSKESMWTTLLAKRNHVVKAAKCKKTTDLYWHQSSLSEYSEHGAAVNTQEAPEEGVLNIKVLFHHYFRPDSRAITDQERSRFAENLMP
jgi:hypothetical protein